MVNSLRPRRPPLSAALLAVMLLSGCATAGQAPSGAGPRAADKPPPTPLAFAVPIVRSEQLIGKDAHGLRGLIGPPTLLRRDHGAEMWQYAGRSCVLFAYLYPDTKGVVKVSYLDARAKTAGAVPVPDCLDALARESAGAPRS